MIKDNKYLTDNKINTEGMIHIPAISCLLENHGKMNYEYVCTNSNCLKHSRQLSCFNCCQEHHRLHVDDVISLKKIIVNATRNIKEASFNALQFVLRGVESCTTAEELKININELIEFSKTNQKRCQQIIDEEMNQLKGRVERHYVRKSELKNKQPSFPQVIAKNIISPIFTFKENHSVHFKSPFKIESAQNTLTTIFAYPSLSKFYESIEFQIKIERTSPCWLGIGLSIGENQYTEKSANHILSISNGWFSNKSILEKTNVRFGGGDVVRVRWDKETERVEFSCRGEKHSVQLQDEWKNDIYICVCLFYKGDSVSIVN